MKNNDAMNTATYLLENASFEGHKHGIYFMICTVIYAI